MSDAEFLTLKIRTKGGEITTLQVGELLEIDGLGLHQFCHIEASDEEPSDPLLERAVLSLQERVTALEFEHKARHTKEPQT